MKSHVHMNSYLNQYLYTSISIKNCKTRWYIHIWTHGLRKECNQELWRKYLDIILFGAYNPGVYTSRFNKLFDILIIQRSGVVVFFPFLSLVSSSCHIWLQRHYFPVRLRLIPRPEKIVTTSLRSFSSTTLPHILFVFRTKNSRQHRLKICTRKGVCGTKNFLQGKVVPFVSSRPSNPMMYVCTKDWVYPLPCNHSKNYYSILEHNEHLYQARQAFHEGNQHPWPCKN